MALVKNEMNHKTIVGHRLETLRLKKKPGYNKRDVADELGLPHSTYNDYEGGRRGLSSDKLILFAKYYNTSVDYITGKTDDDYFPSKKEMEDLLNDENLTLTWKGKPLTDEQIEKLSKVLSEILEDSK